MTVTAWTTGALDHRDFEAVGGWDVRPYSASDIATTIDIEQEERAWCTSEPAAGPSWSTSRCSATRRRSPRHRRGIGCSRQFGRRHLESTSRRRRSTTSISSSSAPRPTCSVSAGRRPGRRRGTRAQASRRHVASTSGSPACPPRRAGPGSNVRHPHPQAIPARLGRLGDPPPVAASRLHRCRVEQLRRDRHARPARRR